jgi:predicted NBD/HSP70 family sugar kinase
MVLVNLNGDILLSRHTEQEISLSNEDLITRLNDIINELNLLVEERGLNLLGIGVGFSGIIYPLEGIIYKSIPLQIDKPLDILSPLQEKADVPVYIENDANCCAWGELAFHKTSQLKNFIFVLLEIREQEVVRKNFGGIAVGLGIVMDGRVYYGHNCSSGEFRSVFAKRTNLSQFSLSKEELLKINESEDIFIRFADELSKNLALLISTLNVSHVFLSSCNVKFKDDIIPILKENLSTLLPYPTLARCEVRFSSMEELTVAYGAAGMLLERLFAHPVIPQAGQAASADTIKIF